jgi:hypothetical protein
MVFQARKLLLVAFAALGLGGMVEGQVPPTPSPSVDRFAFLAALLLPNSGNLDTSTPQYLALNWLANVDPAALPLESTPFEVFLDRFVLSLFHFAHNGDQWTSDNLWLSVQSVCEWEFIACNDEGRVVEIDDIGELTYIRGGKLATSRKLTPSFVCDTSI